ncbi:gliding-motility protein MglA [bacterium]|jgi:signal recognition particle receptor subunit beta|nr:gliding-motility protein MglA [bacterium]
MSFVNAVSREVNCKIVYVGTGLSGKTTNVQYVYENTHSSERSGKLVSLSTENERTLFFDFLPLSVGEVRGYKTRFHLYTIPGQTFYEASRDFILKGVDGVVFVVDSAPERMDANIEAWDHFQQALLRQGYDLARIPVVFQYNKRDLPNAAPIEELEKTFNLSKKPSFEAVANRGEGVMETLESISQMVMNALRGLRTNP